ncbi:MAG: DnaJ domain-containing protein [Bacteroidales bacterium]|nr:DnaJ domain-containing protein [Bacteroidales bacterium]
MSAANPENYYRILGVEKNASIDQIKKAYRKKARLYHPDLNKQKNAKDLFVLATEAYQFLLQHHETMLNAEQEYNEFLAEWIRYRQHKAREKAYGFTREKYVNFRKSRLYKSSMVLDKTILLISISISIIIIFGAIYGYIWRVGHSGEGFEEPVVGGFIIILVTGLVFLGVSVFYTIAFYQTKNKLDINEKKIK